MPEKNQDKEAPDEEEKEEIPDNELSTEEGEKADDKEKPESSKKKVSDKKKQPPVKNKFRKIKWIFIIVIGVLLVASGIGFVFMPEKFHSLFKKDFKGPVIVNEDNLSEEIMSPFLIPPGATNKAIRIDLSIVWDGIASIRFKKNELSTRNMMYERFYKLAGQHQDLNIVKSDLENEIGSMLRSSLGVQNLIIRIKEIRYF
jgi:hypothetical protein